jgi:UDP-N-acetylmuramoylalanine--D-glutamate ligase
VRWKPTKRKRSASASDDEELHIQRLMPADALRIRGRHNAVNALAALALAADRRLRAGPHAVRPARIPGRAAPRGAVGIVNDVEYFDDSKGTNVGATVAALQRAWGPTASRGDPGRRGQGAGLFTAGAPVARHARAVVLIGRDAPLIRAALERQRRGADRRRPMHEAVRLATPAGACRRCGADVAGLRQL